MFLRRSRVCHLLARLQCWLCRVLLLYMRAWCIVLVWGKSRFGNRRQHWPSIRIRHVFTRGPSLQLLIQVELGVSTYWIETLAILSLSTSSKPRALWVLSPTMPLQLLELLVILLRMLLLRCGLIILIGTALADKASFLGDVDWVALVYIGESMFWNSNLLALVLLATSW